MGRSRLRIQRTSAPHSYPTDSYRMDFGACKYGLALVGLRRALNRAVFQLLRRYFDGLSMTIQGRVRTVTPNSQTSKSILRHFVAQCNVSPLVE